MDSFRIGQTIPRESFFMYFKFDKAALTIKYKKYKIILYVREVER